LRYIDASIPLCAFFGEPEEKLEACRQIIKKIERGEEKARTSVFTVAEIVHVLMKRERPARIEEIMKRFFGCAGLRVGDARRDLCLPALELALRYRVDFVDAHHRLTMKLYGIDEIYSLDRHFDRFPGVRRLESV
jgi:predicted nucleic acid-binding protein